MKIIQSLTKLKNWFIVMLTTSTVTGPVLYFQRVYFLHTIISLVSVLHNPTGKKLRAKFERNHDQECVIKNTLGTFAINAKNDSLTKSISSFEYKHHHWLSIPENKDIFIDIGANIGFYSILATKKFGYKHAFAFEPNPPTYDRIQKNIQLNQLEQIITSSNAGLSNTEGQAKLGTRDVHTGASSFVLQGSNKHITEVNVPITTFDLFSARQNLAIAQISFIKIDVEDFEYQVLTGMKETLPKLTLGTRIFIEIHPRAEHAIATHNLLKQAGFTCEAGTAQNNFLYYKTI